MLSYSFDNPVILQQSFFSIEKALEKFNPVLHINVYDFDIFSTDDLLG